MRHSTITDNGTLVSLDDPKKRVKKLKADIERLMKAWRVLSQGGCIDPRNGQEYDAVKELDGYLYLETDIDAALTGKAQQEKT